MIAVIDTGPLLVFAKLQRLHLLEMLYTHLWIPTAVHHESVTIGLECGYADAVQLQAYLVNHRWPVIQPATIHSSLTAAALGIGERHAIAIALEKKAALIIDDSEARRVAEKLGVTTLGSLGVLVQAFRRQLLTPAELDEMLSTIENRTDIWIRPELCERIRQALLGS